MNRYLVVILITVFVLALSGCSALGVLGVTVPTETKVQVPVACIPEGKRPKAPTLRTETDLWLMDDYHRTLAAWSDLKSLRDVYLPEAEAVLEGCSKLPAAKPTSP